MSDSVTITVHDVSLTLFAARAAMDEETSTLFVADPHFGKEATFRAGGVPVPRGSTDGTLATLTELLHRTAANRLVILGDMFHARSSLSDDVRASIDAFWSRHAAIEFVLIRGNHDARVGQLPRSWPIRISEPGDRLGDIVLAHHPTAVPDDAKLLLGGHIHPAIRLDHGHETFGKLPCFWLSQGCLVLPAIGQFTGTHTIRPTKGDQVWAVAGNEIFSAPTGFGSTRS